ncbi:MAG: biotin carboxylase N-terminal domain-containing protein, partial [Pseudomonadota bacterium]
MTHKPITKLLIANRGEIACRIIRAARALDIATVAVYSDADARAMHVTQADEAVHIGGNASADSYLNQDNIFKALALSGADALNPGYGFLSENADFVEKLQARGVTFVGPGHEAIAAMGD